MKNTFIAIVLLFVTSFAACDFGYVSVLNTEGKQENLPVEELNIDNKIIAFEENFYRKLSSEKVVLFFYEKTAASSKFLLEQLIKRIDVLPQNTKILVLDFETELDMREKYKVMISPVLVFIEGGKEIERSVTPFADVLILDLAKFFK